MHPTHTSHPPTCPSTRLTAYPSLYCLHHKHKNTTQHNTTQPDTTHNTAATQQQPINHIAGVPETERTARTHGLKWDSVVMQAVLHCTVAASRRVRKESERERVRHVQRNVQQTVDGTSCSSIRSSTSSSVRRYRECSRPFVVGFVTVRYNPVVANYVVVYLPLHHPLDGETQGRTDVLPPS